jgi:hypothetical protein
MILETVQPPVVVDSLVPQADDDLLDLPARYLTLTHGFESHLCRYLVGSQILPIKSSDEGANLFGISLPRILPQTLYRLSISLVC